MCKVKEVAAVIAASDTLRKASSPEKENWTIKGFQNSHENYPSNEINA